MLGLHRDLLQESYSDAKRLLEHGLRPCYVVDYQLLHWYIYREGANPQRVAELEYLFGQLDLTFIWGSGTLIELVYGVQKETGVDVSSPFLSLVTPETFEQSIMRVRQSEEVLDDVLEKEARHFDSLRRLQDLLAQENVHRVSDIEAQYEQDLKDESAVKAAMAVLRAVRPSPQQYYPNVADALNFANVIQLRRATQVTKFGFFAYLLTSTRPLLNERNWAADPLMEALGLSTAISRPPLNAIYSRIVSEESPDPVQAVKHSLRLTREAAEIDMRLERSLESGSGSIQDISDSGWEDFVRDRSLGEDLSEQLSLLSEFVRDPIISKAQHIYDYAPEVLRETRQHSSSEVKSARKLFDIVVGIAESLSTSSLLEGWDQVVQKVHVKRDTFDQFVFSDLSNEDAPPYAAIEHNFRTGLFALRWPRVPDIERVMSAFMIALARHEIMNPILFVGTSEDVIQFDTEVPITWGEIEDSVGQSICWVRLCCGAFELYADAVYRPDDTPVVGLIARYPHRADIADLYSSTSSRFLFGSWLARAFDEAGLPV